MRGNARKPSELVAFGEYEPSGLTAEEILLYMGDTGGQAVYVRHVGNNVYYVGETKSLAGRYYHSALDQLVYVENIGGDNKQDRIARESELINEMALAGYVLANRLSVVRVLSLIYP